MIFVGLFLVSCSIQDEMSIPSEGYFIIETDKDGELYLESIAPAPHEGVKVYFCRTSTGMVIEIEDPFCGTPKRMNLTEIIYVSSRKENGSAVFENYSPVIGDEIFVNEIFYDESHKYHENTLQLVVLTDNELGI